LSIGAPTGYQYIYAAGFSYALKYVKREEAMTAYIGDGVTSTNRFHAGLNFAVLYRAPVAFFGYNKQYATTFCRSCRPPV